MKLPYVIVIGHQKGGTGKSSISFNISVELAKQFPTTIVDLDSLNHSSKFNSRRDEPMKSVEIKTSDDLKKFLQGDDGLTVIDLGGYDSDLSRTALLLADMVITPMNEF